nr:hypothetical protein [Tanacetum cinerariifolium]
MTNFYGVTNTFHVSNKDDDDDDNDDDDNDKSINLKNIDDEEIDDEFMHSDKYVHTDDEFVQGDEQVNNSKDEEMTNTEDAETENDDEERTDAAKADAEKTKEVKDDTKKAKIPITSSSLSTHDKHQALYGALLNSLILDDDIACGQADAEKVLRKRDRDGEDPSAGSNKEEPIFKMTKDKAPKQDCFKQPSRPPTPDPKWNKHQVVLDQPKQPWFNQMVSAAKDPLLFDELMAIPIDFSMYAMNRIKINNLTQAHLEECFKALTDKLDWNNPKGDRCPFDLTKPLPLKGRPGRLTITAEYFFNNDLEFLKSSDPEKKYNMSITMTKAARYKIVGIKDMVLTLWSATKVGVSAKKLHGYGHLEEIVVRRADRRVYKFKEGDFVDLHLNDIEDMLLLMAQHKLFQLDGSVIVDLIVALHARKTDPKESRKIDECSGTKDGIQTDDTNIMIHSMLQPPITKTKVNYQV